MGWPIDRRRSEGTETVQHLRIFRLFDELDDLPLSSVCIIPSQPRPRGSQVVPTVMSEFGLEVLAQDVPVIHPIQLVTLKMM